MDATEDQDFSKLSIEARLVHKNWKARVSGYEELAKLFPICEEREFQKYSPHVKKFPLDTNAAALEKGLSAVLPYVDYCPVAGKYVTEIISGIVTKCLASTRAKTREIASDIVLMYVEIEKQDEVLDALIVGLEQKTPKNVAAVIATVKKCLNQFGFKVISIKKIVPNLAKLFDSRDPNIREEAKQLTIEIYRWVKDALLPQLNQLKPIQLQELNTEFEKVKDQKASPQRLLRSQQQRVENDDVDGGAMSTEGETGTVDKVPEEVDPFELMEEVDIISKLPNDFNSLIEAKKWQERKDGLEKLQQLLEAHPKLDPKADYGELMKQLKKIVSKDSNIVVGVFAIKCIGLLATGLRKHFHSHAVSTIAVLVEKFKEKKANVVQALREAIDAAYQSTSLESISDDHLIPALDNKNPSIRSEIALFLARSFAKTNPALINKALLKKLITALLKTLNDSDATVRESSAEALGTAFKAQGERNMLPLLQGLEQLKMTKIEEYRDKAEVKKFAALPPQPSSAPVVKPKTAPGGSKKATIVKPKLASSAERLDELSDLKQPEPVVKKSVTKPVVKSRLGIDSSGASGGGSSRVGTVSRRGVTSSTSRLAKPSGLSTTTQSGVSSAKKQDEQSGPLMSGNHRAKEQRFADEKALKILKWNFTAPREEFYQQLKEQMTAAEWNHSLVSQCFHNDFKYHIKAIDLMRDFFAKSANPDLVVANLDLILKWIALRFFDTNPSVIMKALELLLVMFRQLEDFGYTMNDLEANSFLPYLVLKVGDPKDVVRNKVHEILVLVRSLYSAPKIFGHLFAGLQSKNSRQRATCLEEIGLLIELKGMSIFAAPNSISQIKDLAKFIAERDNAVRNGALACIVQVYFLEGEKVFKLVGNLSDKEMSLVEERIKRASKNRPPPPSGDSKTPGLDSNGHNFPTQSSLPALSSRLHTPDTSHHRSIPQLRPPTDLEQPSTGSPSISKLSSMSALRTPENSHGYEIGATFSKSKSASNIRTRLSGSSRLLQQALQNQRMASAMSAVTNKAYEIATSDEEDVQMATHHISQLNLEDTESGSDTNVSSNGVCIDRYADLDRRVQEALNLPELKMPLRKVDGSPKTPRGSPRSALLNPELTSKFTNLFNKLSSTELQPAIEALEQFNVAVKDHAKYGPYLESKVDQLIVLCNKQYWLFLDQHWPRDETLPDVTERRQRAEQLFRAVTSLLVKLFSCPLGKLVSRDMLQELIRHLLAYFAEMKDHASIFQAANYLCTVLLNPEAGADATALFTSLIRLLSDFVGESKTKHLDIAYKDKCLEIIMKFLWRITKNMDKYIEHLNIDQILLEVHKFFKEYPRSKWQKNKDLPLRTLKTLIYFIVEHLGDSILGHLTLIDNKNDSEMLDYIQKAIRQTDRQNLSNGSKLSNINELSNVSTPKTMNGDSAVKTLKVHEFDRLKDCTLQMRVINTEDGPKKIPVIQNQEDMRQYISLTAKQLDMPLEVPKNVPKIHSVEEAEETVRRAQQRFAYLKAQIDEQKI